MRLCKFHHASNQITETIHQMCRIPFVQTFPGDIGVLYGVHMAKQEVASSLSAVFLNQLVRTDDISERLGHFHAAGIDEAMIEDLVGVLYLRRHEHRLPHDGLKTDLVFPRYLKRECFLPEFPE